MPVDFDFVVKTNPPTPDDKLIERIVVMKEVHRFDPVGSRVTCDPAPNDTDIDYLIQVEDLGKFIQLMQEEGFERGGSELVDEYEFTGNPDQEFQSFKRGNLNLIATPSDLFYDRFLAASSVAKRLNLLDKADRIALFQAVLYGNQCGPKTTTTTCVNVTL